MISVIIPTLNEDECLQMLYDRLASVAVEMPEHDFEFILVDDCSDDETPDILQEIAQKDHRLKIIRFARNCGSHAAVAAGLTFCNGNVAVMLAADLQDPPEIIPRLHKEFLKGYKVVWGVRDQREGEGLFTLASSRAFYFLMNRLTDVRQPPAGADVFLIDRAVINAFKNSPEKNTSIYMLIAWLGFPQTYIEYTKEKRHGGVSKWNTSKRLKLFFDSLISFSYFPLRFMSMMGAISALLGLLYSLVVLVNFLVRGNPAEGWSSLMIVLLLIGGFQMIMMGTLGEYVWRAYDETRGRPRYVIEKNTLLEGISAYNEKKDKSDKDHSNEEPEGPA
ncbi:MAG: glycosyltransferase [Deltaproteobacteria bacterium]|nr:glycosyltransferase [Deltaproteobacteria bacterium]